MTMGSEMELARAFLTRARSEIAAGGEYRTRLYMSPQYRQLAALVSNAPAIIERAEALADVESFFTNEMEKEYGRLREHEWWQNNFDWPFYRREDHIFGGETIVLHAVKTRFRQLAARASPEDMRRFYKKAAYKYDGAFLADWEAHYGPIRVVPRPTSRVQVSA